MSHNQTIDIQHLSKNYGSKQALHDINLTIGPGVFGLLGQNGAGKTTLMKVLSTLLPPTDGSVNILGHDIKDKKAIRQCIGYLPQDFSMYPNMSVLEAMNYLALLSNLTPKEAKGTIDNLLVQVNLSHNRKTKVKALSGGMRRRLGIAAALIHDPSVIIVDEPTAGLDPEERIRFRNLFSEIAKDRIVLLSTHIVGDIEATCHQLAILDEGKILFKGKVEELIEAANGSLYSGVVSMMELDDIKKNYSITSMIPDGDRATLRFISHEAPSAFPNASLVTPNLEDAYLSILQQKRQHQGGVSLCD